MFKKQYVCIWGTGYVDSPKTEVHSHTWFLEGRGYTAEMYDGILDLDEHEMLDLTDLSGYHIVYRIQDLEYFPEERTQALFTAWRKGRLIDEALWKYTYPDCSIISISEPTFTVHVGNQEIQTDDLEEAERWLWNNWVAGEKEAGPV